MVPCPRCRMPRGFPRKRPGRRTTVKEANMKHSPERGTRILRAAILLSTLYAVLMMLHWPIGFTFFTLLSNLFAAAVVLLLAAARRERVKR